MKKRIKRGGKPANNTRRFAFVKYVRAERSRVWVHGFLKRATKWYTRRSIRHDRKGRKQ